MLGDPSKRALYDQGRLNQAIQVIMMIIMILMIMMMMLIITFQAQYSASAAAAAAVHAKVKLFFFLNQNKTKECTIMPNHLFRKLNIFENGITLQCFLEYKSNLSLVTEKC